jgi:hypothetical protein
VARRVDQVQQVVVAPVVVYHGACLRLDGNAPLSLHVQAVEDLLLAAGLDGARELQQAVRQGALAMVDVGYNAEVAVSLDRDVGDAFLQVSLRTESLRIATGGVWEAFKVARREGAAIEADGMRPPALQEAARGSDA